MNSRNRIVIMLLCFVTVSFLHAQVNSFRFKHLGIADGLPQSSVYCMYQDQKGFIWIGTIYGLSRYDGYEFKHFKFENGSPYSISSNELAALQEDAMGNLLVGTVAGVDLYDRKKERFSKVLLEGKTAKQEAGVIRAICKDHKGNIWVGGTKGLLRYNPQTRTLSRVPLNIGEKQRMVTTIAEDVQHVLWLGYGNTVLRYDPVTQKTLPLPQALLQNPYYTKSPAYIIKHDAAQNVWIGTERDGLIVLYDQGHRCVNYRSDTKPMPLNNDMVRAIAFTKEGNTWIGTRNGLYIINANGLITRHIQMDKYDPASLSGNSIMCFMQDNAGSMWVGTFAGGISINQPGNDNFSYIREQPGQQLGLNYRVVSRVLEDKEYNLWIATEGGGLNFLDRKNNAYRYIHVNPNSDHLVNQEIIKTIQLDAKDNVWIGTLEGLFYYNKTSGAIKRYPLAESARTLLDEQVYGLAQDSSGLWVGTKGGLFFLHTNGSFTRYRYHSGQTGGIVSGDINVIMKDAQGGIWIGTETGLSYLKKGASHFVNYLDEHAGTVQGTSILSLYEDAIGNIWVGTRGGGLKVLNRKENTFHTIDKKYGLSDDIVHGIIQDRQGNLWISFSQSIAKLVLKRMGPPFAPGDVQITNYSVNNGLGTNEFLTATCRTSSGEIMFGGVNGIVAFQPEKLVVNKTKPPVVLTGLLIKNTPTGIDKEGSPLEESITYAKNITLTHDQAYFTIHFAALNYINSATNQYAYTLQGLQGEKEWNYVGNKQSATYTNLDAGNYVFKVKAANNDGLWNDTYTELHIKVLPPIWKTWYAYVLYAAIIGFLLYLFNAYSIKTDRLKQDLQMQQLNREKDQELIQKKLSFFTNISHEIKTPLTLILAPMEKMAAMLQGNTQAQGQLGLMQKNGERLLRLTNQLLDFRKLESGDMQLQVAGGDIIAFVKDITASFEVYAQRRDVQLNNEFNREHFEAWFDDDKLEKILFNLLSNALKFTPPGGKVTLSTMVEEDNIQFKVGDNGSGITVEHLGKIFQPFYHYNDTGARVDGTGIGLAFTKALVELHHGTIEVTSRPATPGEPGYTCFTVTLPAGKAHYAADETRETALRKGYQHDATQVDALPQPGEQDLFAEELEEKPLMLIVEDNPDVLSFMTSHFKERYHVYTARNGKEGWEMALNRIPDIIISDVMMPEMSGTDFCRQLKTDERTSHIPVILLTARTPLTYRMEGFETGADDYITKPFSLALLQVRVTNLLYSRKLLRERYRKDITLQPTNVAITPADELFLGKVMQFIDDNIMEPSLNVEQLGKEVNMSRATLYRKIKALTNQSTIEFIRSVRLKKAAQLLKLNEYTVNEVAYMVGFSDVDYFRKWFKHDFGVTPKEYAAG